jgi:PAS domain S-box-containing protein
MSERPELRAEAFELFLGLCDTTSECVTVLDLDGRIEFASPPAIAQLGGEVAAGRAWAELWAAEHRGEVQRVLAAAARGESARLRTFRAAPGQAPEWWDTQVRGVRGDAAVTRLIACARNMTAEIEARSILDTVVEYVPAALFAKDAANGRFVMLNRAAETLFGASKDEVLGRTSDEIARIDRLGVTPEMEGELFRSGRLIVRETTVEDPFEGERIYRTRVMATFGDEGPRHLIGVGEDVTEERAAADALLAAVERAESASRSKTEFLANMSHEIRTPLNGVVAVADVLARSALDPKQREMVEIVRSSGATLERLLSDVLDLAKLESGAIEIQADAFHLGDAVRAVASLMSMRASEKGVALELAVAPQAETWVLGDGIRVKQILTNLASNAIKFTDRGEVRIEVAGPASDAGASGFRVTVRDTGVGFDAAHRERVFGRFQQADGSITRRFGGTGLGLAISRQLAELMGGALDCDSAPGAGSVFWLTLPLPLAQAPETSEGGEGEQVQALLEAQAEQPIRILLADDHPLNRKVVELILAPLEVELLSVEDGAQAVAAFAQARFDVVLMDMQMPCMDGLEATREIRRLEAAQGLRRTPVVMLSANAMREHLEQSAAAGADRHLAKPISADALINALVEICAEPAEDAGLARDEARSGAPAAGAAG